MRKYYLILILFVLLILAWSPWQTKETAEKSAREIFESEQLGVIDGCGLNCEGCGVSNSQKIPFGFLVEIQFKCAMKDYFRNEKRFVPSINFFKRSANLEIDSVNTEEDQKKGINRNDVNYCDDDSGCVWYRSSQGDPAGKTSCGGRGYIKTCSSCGLLSETEIAQMQADSGLKCFCNSNNRCQKSL